MNVLSNIAIIPARSGSKGIKDKNIRLLCGKPLLAYSVQAAFNSGCFEEVMVSTDSTDYAEIARDYGARVPFLRSKQNSGDGVDKWDAVREVLVCYSNMKKLFESVCVLQPTSPLRSSEDIRAAYELYVEKQAEAVVSVCECEHPPVWAGILEGDLSMTSFDRPEMFTPRQKLPKYYRLNGAIFIARTALISSGNANLYGKNTYAYIMDADKSIDIDTSFDFKYAEICLKAKKDVE